MGATNLEWCGEKPCEICFLLWSVSPRSDLFEEADLVSEMAAFSGEVFWVTMSYSSFLRSSTSFLRLATSSFNSLVSGFSSNFSSLLLSLSSSMPR